MSTTPAEIIKHILAYDWFTLHNGDGGLMPVTFNKGADTCKLVVITGSNATGKSFFRRVTGSYCAKQGWEHIALSMEKRTGADYTDPCMRALMFGSESDKATGGISGHIVVMGIHTAESRTAENILFLDEPDLGLADEYALDAGARIAAYSHRVSHTQLICVVSHRRVLLNELMRAQPEIHHVHMGKEEPASLSAWLERPITRLDLEQLQEQQHALFRKICARFAERKAK